MAAAPEPSCSKEDMKYLKYHGLGNDYIVIHPADVSGDLDPREIRLICDRNYGVGSDGVLLGPLRSDCHYLGSDHANYLNNKGKG